MKKARMICSVLLLTGCTLVSGITHVQEVKAFESTEINFDPIEIEAIEIGGGTDQGFVDSDLDFDDVIQIKTAIYGVLYEGEDFYKMLGMTPKALTDSGITMNCDLDTILSSGEKSEEIIGATKQGSKIKIIVMNNYSNPVPIGRLGICSIMIDDPQGAFSLDKAIKLGDEYQNILDQYEEPFEVEANVLHYKKGYGVLTGLDSLEWDKGEEVIPCSNSEDIYLNFTDGKLSSIQISDDALLLSGLQDNVSKKDKKKLEPAVIQNVKVKRDNILDDLKDAFEQAGLQVDINTHTGEVIMDNNVLFDSSRYDLTAEGEAYLQSFGKSYLSVILSDDYRDSIGEIAIQGHTDSIGSYEYNLELSMNRAQTVMNYILAHSEMNDTQKAVFQEKATATGYAFTNLVYDENGNEDQQASRRVAIKFYINV